MWFTQVHVGRQVDTYCFQYDGHVEEWVGELHGHKQGNNEVYHCALYSPAMVTTLV